MFQDVAQNVIGFFTPQKPPGRCLLVFPTLRWGSTFLFTLERLGEISVALTSALPQVGQATCFKS